MEGGKVVSETVLTKMYSMLRNEAVRRRARAVLESDLEDMEKQLGSYCVEYTGGVRSTLSLDSQDHAESELVNASPGWKTKHRCRVTL